MSVLKMIVEAVAAFVRSRQLPAEVIVPVPPSKVDRQVLPSRAVADGLGAALDLPVCPDCVVKVKHTPELKDVRDAGARAKELDGAYRASATGVAGKTVLLIDDLYRSGATLKAVAGALRAEAGVESIYVITLTKTRSLR